MATAMNLDLTAVHGSIPLALPLKSNLAAADRELVGRIASGDVAAMSVLYDEHAAYVFGLALRIAADRGLAEDIVQETFVGVWRNAAQFDPTRASVRTWIMTIAHNRAIDLVRRKRGRTVSLDAEDGVIDVLPPAPDVWPEVRARHNQQVVARAMANLPDAQRRSLELAYFGGLTQQEIASVTGAPIGTVKSRVRLGLQGLRQLLAADFTGDLANSSS